MFTFINIISHDTCTYGPDTYLHKDYMQIQLWLTVHLCFLIHIRLFADIIQRFQQWNMHLSVFFHVLQKFSLTVPRKFD